MAAAEEEPLWADVDDSSFEDTGSEWEDAGALPGGGAAASSENVPRVAAPMSVDGLGQQPAAPEQPAGGYTSAVRDQAWRTYRRPLEWRCRWVELRLRELTGLEAHYAGLEARLASRQDGGSVPKTEDGDTAEAQQEGDTVRAPAVPRASSTGPPKPQSSPHVVSYPCQVAALDARDARTWRRRRRRAASASLKAGGVDVHALEAPLTEPAPQLVAAVQGDEGSDSDCGTARVFDAVAAVQQKVAALYRQLAAYRTACGLPPAPPRRQHTVRLAAVAPGGGGAGKGARGNGAAGRGDGGGGGVGTSGPTLRRGADAGMAQGGGGGGGFITRGRERSGDLRGNGGSAPQFDISDVVGALGVSTKVVERASHVDIATPGVRRAKPAPWESMPDARSSANALAAAQAAADKAARAKQARKLQQQQQGAAADAAGSSSEDTSDEAYMARHATMENQEKKWRFMPSLPGRGSGAVARGEKQAAAAAAAAAGMNGATFDPLSPKGGDAMDVDDERDTPTAALLKGTPRGPGCGAGFAEWTITRGDGPRRQHVLSLKRTELLL